jgi:hypothetical protein
MTIERTIYLVACVAKKRAGVMEAQDLYASEWFLRARAFVERAQSPWFILGPIRTSRATEAHRAI